MSQSEINQLKIQEAIGMWKRSERDTGSAEVQIAIMTQRLEYLTAHMARHPKDKHTKRRLIMLVAQRSKMLKYLRRTARDRYDAVLEALRIRPTKAFDPTMRSHQFPSTTKFSVKGFGKYTPKRRKKRATPYGEEKSYAGRLRLRKNGTRQRRLQKARRRAAARDAKAAAVAAQADSHGEE